MEFNIMKPIVLVVFIPAVLMVSAPVYAQDDIDAEDNSDETLGQLTSVRRPASVFTGDWITIGAGIGIKPNYDGSDDYEAFPAPIIQGSVSGFDFGARGPGLNVDLVRDSQSKGRVQFAFGPQFRVRSDRSNTIKDPAVALLGNRKTGVELGASAGVSVAKLISPFDRLTISVDTGWDVAGAHKGNVTSPSIGYSSPISRAAFVNLSVNAVHVSGNYARTYFSVDNAGSTASGLPVFIAKGGWKSIGASMLGGYDLSGNALDGGFSLFGLANYSRLTGDAKRSPVTAIRGDADQWFVAAGISYTF
jgi:MipA family protein